MSTDTTGTAQSTDFFERPSVPLFHHMDGVRLAFWATHVDTLHVLERLRGYGIKVQVCLGMYKGQPEVSYVTTVQGLRHISCNTDFLTQQETVIIQDGNMDDLYIVEAQEFMFGCDFDAHTLPAELLGGIVFTEDEKDVSGLDGYTYNPSSEQYIYASKEGA